MKGHLKDFIGGGLAGGLLGALAAMIKVGMIGYAVICVDSFLFFFVIGFSYASLKTHEKRSTQ